MKVTLFCFMKWHFSGFGWNSYTISETEFKIRPGHQSSLKISWPSNYQPDLPILKHEIFLYLAYLRKMWALLVLDNWKAVTNFLVKEAMQALPLSGVTAFYSFSTDFKSRLMPRSVHNVIHSRLVSWHSISFLMLRWSNKGVFHDRE